MTENAKPSLAKVGGTVALGLLLLAGAGVFYISSRNVGEIHGYVRKGPVQTTADVIGVTGDRDVAAYQYEAAGMTYIQKDFVPKGLLSQGDKVRITYWKVNPQMSYTEHSRRKDMQKGFLLPAAGFGVAGLALILYPILQNRRLRKSSEK